MKSPLLERAQELYRRDRKIAKLAEAGSSLAAIGRKFNLTRQRVQQIVRRDQPRKLFTSADALIASLHEPPVVQSEPEVSPGA